MRKKIIITSGIIVAVILCIVFIIYELNSANNLERCEVNCFNDKIKTNAMSVHNKDKYYYVYDNHFIYELLDNGEEKCLVSVPDIYGIAYSNESLYYIASGKLYRYNLNTDENNLVDDEYHYRYISSSDENIYALDIHSCVLLKVNNTEKVLIDYAEKHNNDIGIFYDAYSCKYVYSNELIGVANEENDIIFRSNYRLADNLLYADDNSIITSDFNCKHLLSYDTNGNLINKIYLPEGFSYIPSNVYYDTNSIYLLMQSQKGNQTIGYYNLPQTVHKSDALLKYNVNQESFEYIYKSKNKDERIIGYKDGYILLTYKDNIYKMKEGTNNKEKISSLNKEKDVVFEICGDRIFVWNREDEFLFSCKWN